MKLSVGRYEKPFYIVDLYLSGHVCDFGFVGGCLGAMRISDSFNIIQQKLINQTICSYKFKHFDLCGLQLSAVMPEMPGQSKKCLSSRFGKVRTSVSVFNRFMSLIYGMARSKKLEPLAQRRPIVFTADGE